jgi:hypothetical protein
MKKSLHKFLLPKKPQITTVNKCKSLSQPTVGKATYTPGSNQATSWQRPSFRNPSTRCTTPPAAKGSQSSQNRLVKSRTKTAQTTHLDYSWRRPVSKGKNSTKGIQKETYLWFPQMRIKCQRKPSH